MAMGFSAFKSLVVESSNSAVYRICQRLLQEAAGNNFDEDALFGIHLSLEEAFINAICHGNDKNSAKTVNVKYLITPDKFDIYITDQGKGFNYRTLPDPRTKENICKTGGRGVLLMRSYMNTVEYNDAGNCVHMIKLVTREVGEDQL